MQTLPNFNTPFGVQAYRASVRSAELSRVEEARLIEEARAGDQAARSRLVEACQVYALRRALSLVAWYRAIRSIQLDAQDIAQEAAVRVLLRLDKALASPNPVGYLRRAMEGGMLTFCRERQNAIRVPVCMQSQGRRPVEVLSLDAPMSGDNMVTLADLLPAT